MTRCTSRLLGFTLFVILSLPNLTRADAVWIAPGGGMFTGVDAGVDTVPLSSNLNSVQASHQFQAAAGPAPSTTIDFGSAFTGLQPSMDKVWSATVNTPQFSGLRAETQGIDYSTPPAPYQYGITSSPNPVGFDSVTGFGVGGTGRYEYVPVVGVGSSSFTLHSDTAFQSFGFYLTGLGNRGGLVDVRIDGNLIPGLTLTGSSQGGALFLGYVGQTPIHDLSIEMPNGSSTGRDVFAISDIQLISVTRTIAAVPEPPSVISCVMGFAAVLGTTVLRRERGATSV